MSARVSFSGTGQLSPRREISYLYTSIVTDLDVFNERSECNDDTGTFVSTDKWKLGGQWPVTVHGVEISVADTRVLDVDENLIWTGLLDWNFLVDNSWRQSA
jgi:hypothetical protein